MKYYQTDPSKIFKVLDRDIFVDVEFRKVCSSTSTITSILITLFGVRAELSSPPKFKDFITQISVNKRNIYVPKVDQDLPRNGTYIDLINSTKEHFELIYQTVNRILDSPKYSETLEEELMTIFGPLEIPKLKIDDV